MKYDTLVLGSGVSGMTAAAVLAKEGKKVALLEKQPVTAPLIRSFKRQGFLCEPAFHYTGGLENDGLLSLLYRYLGMDGEIVPVPYLEKGYDCIETNHFEPLNLPNGFEPLKETLSQRFPKSALGIGKYFSDIQTIRKNDFVFNPNLEFATFPDQMFDHTTVNEFFDKAGVERALAEAIGRYGNALYGVPGDEMPFSIQAVTLGSLYQKAFAIEGGGATLVGAYTKALKNLGVDVYTKEQVKTIQARERKFTAVETVQGNLFEADNCICSFHPALLLDMLPRDQVRPVYFNRLKRMKNSCRFGVTYYGIEKEETPEELKYSNIYRFESLFEGEEEDLAIINNQAEDLLNPSNQNRAVAFISYFRDRDFPETMTEKEYHLAKRKLADYHQQRLFSRFPGLQGKVKELESSTPLSYKRYTGTPEGAMYGFSQSVHQRNIGYSTSLRSLYLCGQSVIPGVLGAIVSSLLACDKLIDMKPVWRRIAQCR